MTASVPIVAEVTRRIPLRAVVLGLAGVRAAVEILALFLAPALFDDHFVLLTFLRPTKEVLLTGGFLVRTHEVALVSLLVAAVPLMLGGVWLFYWLGRAWSEEITSGEGLPGWAAKLLPTDRIKDLCGMLQDKGAPVIFFGRLAVFPSTLLAAAAGASKMDPKRFLLADGLGGLLAIVEVVGAGYLLGHSYERGAKWITVVGVVVLLAMLVAMGRWLRGQSSGKGT
jgi:membrane protein DedA with SNARE-associated domain